jgi:phage-related protein
MTIPIHKASPMSPILKEMADYFLEIDSTEVGDTYASFYIDYSDEDVMNALHIFASILGTRFNKS